MSYKYGKPKPVASTINRLPAILLLSAVAVFIAADLLFGFDFNGVDYAVVIIVALFGLKGYFKGLINTVFSLLGYVIGLVGAYLFSPKLALVIQKTSIGKSISAKLDEILPILSSVNATAGSAQQQSTLDVITQIPDVNKAMTENPILEFLMSVTKPAAETSALYEETISTANDLIVYSILKVVALIILFIVIKLVVIIIGKLLSKAMGSSAILGTANRSAGMFIGFAAGLIVCYVVFLFAIPTLGSLNIVKISENYTQSLMLDWFSKLLLLLQ